MMQDQDLWGAYNSLLLSEDFSRIQKLIIRYEMFKKSLNVPGDIVECGVFKGAGWMYWLKLLHLFSPHERKRVIGFDTFDKFADSLLEYEKNSADEFTIESGYEGCSALHLQQLADAAGFSNGVLVEGDVTDSIPEFVNKNPGMRISLLNIDFDTYSGTRMALEWLYDLLTPGAIVLLDEYGVSGWGESDAVDEFLEGKGIALNSIRGSNKPTAFFSKPL